MATNAQAERLQAGLVTLGVSVSPAQHQQLVSYLDGLSKWNRAYNLTSVRDPDLMVVRHLLDSAAIVSRVPAGPCLDVGSGAGLPGLVLAICQPERWVVCLDGNGKKVRFIRQMAMELGLANVTAVQSRVEAYRPASPFAVITSRAFASLDRTLELTQSLLAPAGCYLFMKGHYPATELARLPAGYRCTAADQLDIPGLDEARTLIRVEPE